MKNYFNVARVKEEAKVETTTMSMMDYACFDGSNDRQKENLHGVECKI